MIDDEDMMGKKKGSSKEHIKFDLEKMWIEGSFKEDFSMIKDHVQVFGNQQDAEIFFESWFQSRLKLMGFQHLCSKEIQGGFILYMLIRG